MKRKAAQNVTVLSATRPEISVLEQTALSIDTESERERIDGALRTSKGPQKGTKCFAACTDDHHTRQDIDSALACCRAWNGVIAIVPSAAYSRAACVDIIPDCESSQQELG